MACPPPLRIGYVPEHFSAPLHFARIHFALSATLIPFPSGTGHMVSSLRANELDIAIGLAEGFVTALANPPPTSSSPDEPQPFKLVGTYVETPLCWAISTGVNRHDISSIDQLRRKKLGVSRIGSGSYVMGFVLADQMGWLPNKDKPRDSEIEETPFSEILPLQTFSQLRSAVNDGVADFFLWEHFTSKRYYDLGHIKRIGEIYTPWSSWKIAARDEVVEEGGGSGLGGGGGDSRLEDFFKKLNQGVKYFEENGEEAVRFISEEMDYGEGDARSWMQGV
ncbi:MAG: hypothetical protein Q9190_008112, partial [Brigantiaea leucoxantha]